MSGKFMKVKKIFIPTLTALLLASQLCGCAATSENELLEKFNNNTMICIELADDAVTTDENKINLDWTELAYQTNYSDFRFTVDDALQVTNFSTNDINGKNGVMYVDLEGNHTDNSTFYYAMMNKQFRNMLADTDIMKVVKQAAKDNYTDVTSDSEAKLAFINAYFSIFKDTEPNNFAGNSTLTRAEFLAGLYKAENPVIELTSTLSADKVLDANNECSDTIYAEQMLDYSYLTLEDNSLNDSTFNNGGITRAEAIYTLVTKYFASDYEAVTGKEEIGYTDAKNGGNIASKQGFIEVDKKAGTTDYKQYWKAYELQYSINNADKGLPEALYKAMVVAYNKGLINDTESRWDEALTKSEALDLIYKVYNAMDTITDADRGNASGESNAVETTETNTSSNEEATNTEAKASSTEENVWEEMNKEHPELKMTDNIKVLDDRDPKTYFDELAYNIALGESIYEISDDWIGAVNDATNEWTSNGTDADLQYLVLTLYDKGVNSNNGDSVYEKLQYIIESSKMSSLSAFTGLNNTDKASNKTSNNQNNNDNNKTTNTETTNNDNNSNNSQVQVNNNTSSDTNTNINNESINEEDEQAVLEAFKNAESDNGGTTTIGTAEEFFNSESSDPSKLHLQ